jgi:hypothetical protein
MMLFLEPWLRRQLISQCLTTTLESTRDPTSWRHPRARLRRNSTSEVNSDLLQPVGCCIVMLGTTLPFHAQIENLQSGREDIRRVSENLHLDSGWDDESGIETVEY